MEYFTMIQIFLWIMHLACQKLNEKTDGGFTDNSFYKQLLL